LFDPLLGGEELLHRGRLCLRLERLSHGVPELFLADPEALLLLHPLELLVHLLPQELILPLDNFHNGSNTSESNRTQRLGYPNTLANERHVVSSFPPRLPPRVRTYGRLQLTGISCSWVGHETIHTPLTPH